MLFVHRYIVCLVFSISAQRREERQKTYKSTFDQTLVVVGLLLFLLLLRRPYNVYLYWQQPLLLRQMTTERKCITAYGWVKRYGDGRYSYSRRAEDAWEWSCMLLLSIQYRSSTSHVTSIVIVGTKHYRSSSSQPELTDFDKPWYMLYKFLRGEMANEGSTLGLSAWFLALSSSNLLTLEFIWRQEIRRSIF